MMGFFHIPCTVCNKLFGWQSSNPQVCSDCGPISIVPWIQPNTTGGFPNFQTGHASTLTPSKGWECPRCERVYGPQVTGCLACNSLISTTRITVLPHRPDNSIEPVGVVTTNDPVSE